MKEQVEHILEKRIRAQLMMHGGDVELLFVQNGTIHIRLLGQCANCPASYFITEQMIQRELLQEIPEVYEVVVEHHVGEDLIQQAKERLRRNHNQCADRP